MSEPNNNNQTPMIFASSPKGETFLSPSRTCEMPCEELLNTVSEDVRKAEAIKNPRMRNSYINDRYGALYRSGISGDYDRNIGTPPLGGSFSSPNYWSGMASIVSSQVGCVMDFVENNTGIDWGDGINRATPGSKWVIDLLGDANLNIFQHMYPPMATLSQCGYEKYLHCVEELKKIDDKKYKDFIALGPAVKDMRDGKYLAAADQIISYEQRTINQETYDEHWFLWRIIKGTGWVGSKVGINLQDIPVSSACGASPKIPFTGDLIKADDRIKYFWKLFNNWNGQLW